MREKAGGGIRESGDSDLQASRIERWIRYRLPCRVELRGKSGVRTLKLHEGGLLVGVLGHERTSSFARCADFRSGHFIVYQKKGTTCGVKNLTYCKAKMISQWVSNER